MPKHKTELQLYYAEAALVTLDTHFELELTGIDHLLTESELSVVEKIYLLVYTVAETAAINEISRQAVNKTKKRALKKLAKWFGQQGHWGD